MGVDPVAGPSPDLPGDLSQAEIRDVGRPATARADDVVVMGRLAGDVGMPAGGQLEPLDEAEFGEQVEGPEDRRPSDPEPLRARLGDELGGREMTRLRGDQRRHGAPRLGGSVARAVEGGEE